MKKFISTLIAILAVTVYLNTGQEFKADKVVKLTNIGVTVLVDGKKLFLPNDKFVAVDYDTPNYVRDTYLNDRATASRNGR